MPPLYLVQAGSASCWHADLDAAPVDYLSMSLALSSAERERAARFFFRRDRLRYLAAHSVLRHLLAARTGLGANELRFSIGPNGKPALVNAPDTQFSLSHSRSTAVVAIGRPRGGTALGVDVEQLRPVPDALGLAGEYFTELESLELAALDDDERELAFLTCWTRKEACLKAVGHGLMLAPNGFEVGLAPVRREVALTTPRGRLQLVLMPLPSHPGTVASLAECPLEAVA